MKPVCVPVYDTFAQSPKAPTVNSDEDTTCSVPLVYPFENPPPLSRSPGDWIISEAVCINQLVKYYGWKVIEAGQLRRVRKVGA